MDISKDKKTYTSKVSVTQRNINLAQYTVPFFCNKALTSTL